jgi:hypothetical protein
MMTYTFVDHNADLAARFNWIVGPVLAAYLLEGTSRAIVVQGRNAYAVVDQLTREYFACCPTFDAARARCE